MSLAKASLWLVMGMVGLTTLACAVLVAYADSLSEAYNFLLFTFLALALLAPLAAILHRRQYRAGGMVLCAVFLFMWASLLAAIFQPGFLDRFGSAIFTGLEFVFFMGLPLGVGLMCVGKPWGKWFAWSLAGVVVICLPITLAAMATGGDIYSRLGMTGMYSFMYLGSGTVLLINVGQGDRRYFRWLGVAAALAATVVGFISIWHFKNMYAQETKPWNCAGNMLWAGCGTLALVNLLLMTWRPGLVRWLQWSAIGLTVIAGAALMWLFWLQLKDFRQTGDWVFRFAGSAGTLAAGAMVMMLVGRTMLRLNVPVTVPLGVDRVKLSCPICGTEQQIGLTGACHKCLVQFKIVVTEPRCAACAHLLLNLTSDRCPECGVAVVRPVELKERAVSP